MINTNINDSSGNLPNSSGNLNNRLLSTIPSIGNQVPVTSKSRDRLSKIINNINYSEAKAFENTMKSGIFLDENDNEIPIEELATSKTFGINTGVIDDKILAYRKNREGKEISQFDYKHKLKNLGEDISGLYPYYNEKTGDYILKATKPGLGEIRSAKESGLNIINFYGSPKYSGGNLGSFYRGLSNVAADVIPSIYNVSSGIKTMFGGEVDQDYLQNVNDFWDLMNQTEEGTQVSQNEPMSSAEGIFGTLGQGIGSVLEYMALASPIAKGGGALGMSEKAALKVGMAASGMFLNGGEAYKTALNAGLSSEESAGFMVIVGGINTLIENKFGANALTKYMVLGRGAKEIPEVILKQTGGDISKLALDKATKPILTQVFKGASKFLETPIIGTGLEEGFEEGIQSLTLSTSSVLYDKFLADKGAEIGKGKFGTRFNEDMFKQSFHEAFAGALTGSLMGIPAAFSERSNKNKKISDKNIVDDYIANNREQYLKDQGKNLLENGALTEEQYKNFNSRIDYLVNLRDNAKDMFSQYQQSSQKDNIISSAIEAMDLNNIILDSNKDIKDINEVDDSLINLTIKNKNLGTFSKFQNDLNKKGLHNYLNNTNLISDIFDNVLKRYNNKIDNGLHSIYTSQEIEKRVNEFNLRKSESNVNNSLSNLRQRIQSDKRIKDKENIDNFITLHNDIINKENILKVLKQELETANNYDKVSLEKTILKIEEELKEDNLQISNINRKSIPNTIKNSIEYEKHIQNKIEENQLKLKLLQSESYEEINYDLNNRKLLKDIILNNVINKVKENVDNVINNIETEEDVNSVINSPQDIVTNNLSQDENTILSQSSIGASQLLGLGNKEVINKQENNIINQLQSEGKDKYSSLEEAINKKYTGNPNLAISDLNNIINKIGKDETTKEYDNNIIIPMAGIINKLLNTLKANKNTDTLKRFVENDLKPNPKFSNTINQARQNVSEVLLKLINESVVNNKSKEESKSNVEELNNPSDVDPRAKDFRITGVTIGKVEKRKKEIDLVLKQKENELSSAKTDKEIELIENKYKEILDNLPQTYHIRNNTKGKNFISVTQYGDIDRNLVDKGEVVEGDIVYFEVNTKTEYQPTKDDYKKRRFEIVSYKNNKRIVVGLVPVSKDTENLREQLNNIVNKKKYEGIIKTGVSSVVAGAIYEYTKTSDIKSPTKVLLKKDQEIKEVEEIGGFMTTFVNGEEDDKHASTKTNIPIDISEKFEDSNKGDILIAAPHPLMKGQWLYLRGFQRTLEEYGNSGLKGTKERYDRLIDYLLKEFDTYTKVDNGSTQFANIKSYIQREFKMSGSIKDNTRKLVLYKRNQDKIEIPINILEKEGKQILLDWINDSYLVVNASKLNTPIADHDFAGKNERMPYNTLIEGTIGLSTEFGKYIKNVSLFIKDVDQASFDKAIKDISKEVNEETKIENKVVLTKEEDPSQEEVTSDIEDNNIPQGSTFEEKEVIKKEDIAKSVERKKLDIPDFKVKTSLSKKILDNRNKDKFRRLKEDSSLPKWDKEKELKWFKKRFPNVDISVLENLKEIVANGSEYWGVFHNAAVYVAENAATGTLYHEAFHVMFNLFTTPEQRDYLLKEVSSRYNINIKNILLLEEAMADDFMEIIQSEEVPKFLINKLGKVITDFFRHIQSLIKSLYTNPTYGIDEFFWRGNNGFYSKSKVEVGSFGSTVTRARPKGWTYRQEKTAVDALNGYLFTELIPSLQQVKGYENLTPLQIINEVKIDNLYKYIYNELVDVESSEDISKETKTNITELLNNLYNPETNRFLELYNSLIKGLVNYNIRIKPNDEKKLAEEVKELDSEERNENNLQDADEIAEDKRENWMNHATERSSKDTAPFQVKSFIRNMSIPGKQNIFGLDALVDYEDTYNTLLKNLAGSTSVEDMIDYINQELELHPEYQQILDKFEEDPSFKAVFFSAFNNNHTKYNIVSYIMGNWATYQANRAGLTNTIIGIWTENILQNKDVIQIDSTGKTSVKESVKDITSKIREEIKLVIDNWTEDVESSYYDNLSDALEKLGVTMEPKVLKYIGTSTDNMTGKNKLQTFFTRGNGHFTYILNKFEAGLNPFDGGLEAGESEAIKIAANQVAKASPELYESSFRNINGKLVYAHLEQSFLTKLVHRLQNPKHKAKELSFYSQDQLFVRTEIVGTKKKLVFHNRILKDLQEDNSVLDIMVTDGLTDDKGNRISYDKLDPIGLKLYTIHNYFNNGNKTEGFYRATVLSDAPNGVMFKHKKEKKSVVLANLARIAEAEYNKINQIKDTLDKVERGELSKNKLIKNYHIKQNGDIKTGYHIIPAINGSEVDLTSSENEDKVISKINDWLTKEANDYYNSLVQSGIIVIKNGIVSDESRLSKMLMTRYPNEADIKNYIEEFYFNDFLSRTEFSLMTVGDPAFYKTTKGSKNNKTIDYVKRAKQIYSPKSILDIEQEYTDPETGEVVKVGNKYRTIYLNDNNIQSTSYDIMSETIDNLVKEDIISKQKGLEIKAGYEYNSKEGKDGINQTDAQAYITLPFYRKTMLGMGRWTNAHQRAYNNLKIGIGSGSDIALMLQPLKPFSYGLIWSDELRRIIPVQNKNSEYLLLPQLVQNNPKLANLLAFMDGARIDSINFESAVKAGLSKVIDHTKFDTRESTEEFIKEYEVNPSNWIHELNMEDRGIQQEVPEHFIDSKNLFGTQIRKLIMSDLFEGTKYFGDMSAKQLRNKYEELIIADLIEYYESLASKFVTEWNDDGTPNKIDYKYVHQLMLEEAYSRGKGEEFEKAIGYDEKRNRLTLPLYNPITAQSAENILTSIFKSKITKQKIKGGAFVQVSSFGLSKELNLVYNEDKTALKWTEVMLPAFAKDFFTDFIDKNVDINFEEIQKEIPEILEMIGYRIPTEDKYSMLPLKVVGFLPFTAGGAIMLPADITKISGSDFDVDKMYVMMKAFKAPKFNRKEFKKDLREFAKDKESFKDTNLSDRNIDIVVDQIKKGEVLQEKDLPIFDYYTESRNKYGRIKYEVVKYDETKSARENSKLTRDNYKIDLMTSVLRNPYTLESILSGGTYEPLRQISEFTGSKIGSNSRELAAMSLNSMDSMLIDNMTGKSMVGIAANENAFHAIAQHTKLSLKTSINFDKLELNSLHETKAKTYIDFNKETKDIKVIQDAKKLGKISKNKAYYLAAIVDNAKDPIASYINYNSYTSGIVGLMTQVGLDPATITWFLKQPVIVDITNKYFASGEDRNEESKILEEYKDKYSIKKDPKTAPMLTSKGLYGSLIDSLDNPSQAKVFEAFLVYKKLAKDWTALVLSSRADTKGLGPTSADGEVLLYGRKKIIEDSNFSIEGVEDLFNLDTEGTKLVSAFTKYGVELPLQIVTKMFPYSTVDGFYQTIKDKLSSYIKGRELSASERNSINSQITAFLLSKYDLFNPTERDYYLNKFPKEFLEFKEKNTILANNAFVKRLFYKSSKSDPKIPIERIEFNNTGKLTNELKNNIQKDWLDLYESEEYRDMAKKLIIYSYFTTGLSFGISGFSHLIGTDMLSDNGVKDSNNKSIADFMYEILDTAKLNAKESKEVDNFIDQFHKNNYKNKAFVPAVNEDLSNVRESITNEKGEIIGFKIDSNVKDKSLLNDVDFAEYISHTVKGKIKSEDKINIYKKTWVKDDGEENKFAEYTLTNKLGFPNYVYEYLSGEIDLDSVYSNNSIKSTVLEEGNLKKPTIETKVYKAKESEPITEDNFTVFQYGKKDDKYEVTIQVGDKTYIIAKDKNNIYYNIKGKGIIRQDSDLVKYYEKAARLIRKNCE